MFQNLLIAIVAVDETALHIVNHERAVAAAERHFGRKCLKRVAHGHPSMTALRRC